MRHVEDWNAGRYAYHVHRHLQEKEEKMMVYLQQSPQLFVRPSLVEYTTAVCDKMGFCTRVKHLAIYYLDLFMDNHVIVPEHLCLIAVGCISVAVKVDERDCLIPKLSDFNTILGNVYQLKEIIEIEGYVLRFFNWDLLIPTTANFIEYYTLNAVCDTDYYRNVPLVCVKEAKRYSQKYINYFLDVTLKDHRFRSFRPSVVASSCVAASRICLELMPVWPSQLEEVTQHGFEKLRGCIELLFQIWTNHQNALVNQQPPNDPVTLKRKRNEIEDNFSSAKRRVEIAV